METTAQSALPDRAPPGSGRLKHSGVTPLTPITGRTSDPEENHDPADDGDDARVDLWAPIKERALNPRPSRPRTASRAAGRRQPARTRSGHLGGNHASLSRVWGAIVQDHVSGETRSGASPYPRLLVTGKLGGLVINARLETTHAAEIAGLVREGEGGVSAKADAVRGRFGPRFERAWRAGARQAHRQDRSRRPRWRA